MPGRLTVVLPGRWYGAVGAVLRVPALVLEGVGARTDTVDYPAPAGAHPLTAEALADAADAATAQVARRVAELRPERLTFVAKSLGTAVLARLGPDIGAGARTEAIWLTPLFGRDDVAAGAITRGWPSLLVAGSADPAHDPTGHQRVVDGLGASSLVLPGADHSLEVGHDVNATLDRLRELAGAVARFATA